MENREFFLAVKRFFFLGFFLLLAGCAVESAPPGQIPAETGPTRAFGIDSPLESPALLAATRTPGPATPTENNCFPCGLHAGTMTARVPATQTAQALESTLQVLRDETATAQVTATASITATQACGESAAFCILHGHFLLERPILNGKVERTYPYGSTQDDKREAHHGVEFYYAFGTPVLAAGDGLVVFAGSDKLPLASGEPLGLVTNFYGNAVVLEHKLAGNTLYTLYGHLSEVSVAVGDTVKAGDLVGKVGASGKAIGSHLHFEVRLKENSYLTTRNPELWLKPLPGTGVLAGLVRDPKGNLLDVSVNIQHFTGDTLDPFSVGQMLTYAHEKLNGDNAWGETLVFGELPAGRYRLSVVVRGPVYEQIVEIVEGKLTLVRFLTR